MNFYWLNYFGDGIRKKGNGGIFGILNIIGITLILNISFSLILTKGDLRFGRMLRNLNTFYRKESNGRLEME